MARLNTTDDQLGFLNFSSFLTSASSLAKASVPKLVEAGVNRKLAKDAAATARYAAKAATVAPASVAAAQTAQAAPSAPASTGSRFDFSQLWKPAAVLGGAVVAAVALKNRKSKQ